MVNLLVIKKTGRLFTYTIFFLQKSILIFTSYIKILSFLDFTTWYNSLVCHDVYMYIRPPWWLRVRNPPAMQEAQV